ncbi:MAG: META domain-containing protein [Anaerolineae bacterium]|jgi:heat shock protein HslJ
MLSRKKHWSYLVLAVALVALAACAPATGTTPEPALTVSPEASPEVGLTPDTGATPEATPEETPAADATPDGEAENPLVGTSWMLVSFGEPGAETQVIEGSTITLEFDAQGQAGGEGGCNSYSGPYEVQDSTIIFGELVRTLIACTQEGINEQEDAYLEALSAAERFELAEDSLTIWYDGEQGVLNFVPSTAE